ncbi:MAG TPA: DinB family protein [Sphingobium sp.]
MFTDHFRQFAAYNQWANARLHATAIALPEQVYRQPTGVFFGSLHGTLNHLLLTDRMWLTRLTGEGQQPARLDLILHDDRRELALARVAEDERIVATINGYSEAQLDQPHHYRTTSGQPQQQPLREILAHMFNHQTHHRGQAHACLSILTGAELPSLDLLAYQRGAVAPDLLALASAS